MRAGVSLVRRAMATIALVAACDGNQGGSSTEGGKRGQGGGNGSGSGGHGSTTTSTGSSNASTSASVTTATSSSGAVAPHGCEGSDFVVLTEDVVVRSNGTVYEPRCCEITPGTTLRFEDDFATHPLVGGLLVDGVLVPDPESPIPETRAGEEASATFEQSGDFGFYCENHATIAMTGMVRVR